MIHILFTQKPPSNISIRMRIYAKAYLLILLNTLCSLKQIKWDVNTLHGFSYLNTAMQYTCVLGLISDFPEEKISKLISFITSCS